MLISACLLIVTYLLMKESGGLASMMRQLSSLKWQWVAAAILAGVANNVVASWRFLLIIRRIASVQLPFWNIVKVNAAALFLGYWTPIAIAGDGGRIVWLRKGVVDSYA